MTHYVNYKGCNSSKNDYRRRRFCFGCRRTHKFNRMGDERYPCGPVFMSWDMPMVQIFDHEYQKPTYYMGKEDYILERPVALAFKPIMDEGII